MNPTPAQPPAQSPPVQPPPVAPAPVIPVSSEPLTLDPNMMTPQTQAVATPQVVSPSPKQAYPVSGPHKEAAPISQALVTEYVKPTEVAVQLPQEVAEAGVEIVHNAEQPQITPEHQAVGIEPAKEAVPAVVAPAAKTITLPYSPAQAKQIEKQAPLAESRHWLAVLTEFLLKKLQLIPA
ncbi:MAG: hypothetical protein AAB478_00830 [Patescibacteria group bacterium]